MAPVIRYLSETDVPAFPLAKEKLVDLAKQILETQFATSKPELLADDFEFRFPVVELNKERFVEAYGSFQVERAFPDQISEYYGWRLDPHIPGRLWFDVQSQGTHTGKFGGPFSMIWPSNKRVVTPPQTLSFTFNKDGLLTCFTGGYVLDRRMGNTGGLGGVFGLMHGIGWTLPFPEGQPFRLSWRYRIFLWLESVMRFVSSLLATRPTMGSKGE